LGRTQRLPPWFGHGSADEELAQVVALSSSRQHAAFGMMPVGMQDR